MKNLISLLFTLTIIFILPACESNANFRTYDDDDDPADREWTQEYSDIQSREDYETIEKDASNDASRQKKNKKGEEETYNSKSASFRDYNAGKSVPNKKKENNR